MKTTIKKVTIKGSMAWKVTCDYDKQMTNKLKKWGGIWNPTKKAWYVIGSEEGFVADMQEFVRRWWQEDVVVVE